MSAPKYYSTGSDKSRLSFAFARPDEVGAYTHSGWHDCGEAPGLHPPSHVMSWDNLRGAPKFPKSLQRRRA